MVEQYPDTIIITVNPALYQDPDTGIYSAATGTPEVKTFGCRAEINGAGRKVTGRDGSSMDYSFVVYLQKTSYTVPFDASYTLNTRDNGQFTGKVLQAHAGQLNTRIWL